MGQGAGWGRDADKVHLDGHWHNWVEVWALGCPYGPYGVDGGPLDRARVTLGVNWCVQGSA